MYIEQILFIPWMFLTMQAFASGATAAAGCVEALVTEFWILDPDTREARYYEKYRREPSYETLGTREAAAAIAYQLKNLDQYRAFLGAHLLDILRVHGRNWTYAVERTGDASGSFARVPFKDFWIGSRSTRPAEFPSSPSYLNSVRSRGLKRSPL